MSEKVVLITGASSGLGELMAYEYAKRGARLALIAIEEPQSRLKQVADRARELGSPDVIFMFADVSKFDECKAFVDDTVKHFGQLDHLVCNAGIGSTYVMDIDIRKYSRVMDVNFWGSIYTTYFAIPHLKKSHGKIVVNASAAAKLGAPKLGFYGASKAALISFYESLRFEVAPTITVTIVTLGFIDTNIIRVRASTTDGDVRPSRDASAELPMMSAEPCAKAIVDGACKGARSITEPKMYNACFLVKSLCPELLDWYFYKIFLSKFRRLQRSQPSNSQSKAE